MIAYIRRSVLAWNAGSGGKGGSGPVPWGLVVCTAFRLFGYALRTKDRGAAAVRGVR